MFSAISHFFMLMLLLIIFMIKMWGLSKLAIVWL